MRPVAVGYLALPVITDPDAAVDAARAWSRQIVAAAGREGYCLEWVFSDVRGRTESGLYAVVEALARGAAVAVVVPDLSHLRHAGCLSGADARTAARYLHARVLAVDPTC